MSNREILFRGKRVDDGKWIYGYYAKEPDIGEVILLYNGTKQGGCRLLSEYNVIPETVGQFTGLTDKNGKKIFEGDIISFDIYDTEGQRKIKTDVKWAEQGAAFVPWYWKYECEGCDCNCDIENIRIIGNIHDNPELLGGEK